MTAIQPGLRSPELHTAVIVDTDDAEIVVRNFLSKTAAEQYIIDYVIDFYSGNVSDAESEWSDAADKSVNDVLEIDSGLNDRFGLSIVKTRMLYTDLPELAPSLDLSQPDAADFP